MSRYRDQRGAALILIIGVVAALAIMASTLVMVTVNAAGNTKRDRYRAQAFNVAEGLVDYTLAQIGTNWPSTTTPVIDYNAFKSKYASAATQGGFTIQDVSVTFFDDSDANGDGYYSREDSRTYDYNNNGYIYVEAQAKVNGQKARVQVEAKARTLDMQVPSGVAVATNSSIDPNGNNTINNGNPFAIAWDPLDPAYVESQSTNTHLSLLAGGDIADWDNPYSLDPTDKNITYNPDQFGGNGDADATPTGIQREIPQPPAVIDSIVTPTILQSIILSAKMTNRWYSDIPSEQAAGALPIPAKNNTAAWTGTVVVETLSLLDLQNNEQINTVDLPGVLVVIGPHTMYPNDATKAGISGGVKLTGTSNAGPYYGLVYTDGPVIFGGNKTVVGMVVAGGGVTPNGASSVLYNSRVVANLNRAVLVNAQVVPNTWRQIQPL